MQQSKILKICYLFSSKFCKMLDIKCFTLQLLTFFEHSISFICVVNANNRWLSGRLYRVEPILICILIFFLCILRILPIHRSVCMHTVIKFHTNFPSFAWSRIRCSISSLYWFIPLSFLCYCTQLACLDIQCYNKISVVYRLYYFMIHKSNFIKYLRTTFIHTSLCLYIVLTIHSYVHYYRI